MKWRFNTPLAEDAARLIPYFSLRPNKSCDSGWLDFFIWSDYYIIRYCILDEKALLIVMKNGDEYFAALPYCRTEDLMHYFGVLKDFFNNVLDRPFIIYLADEEGVDALGLKDDPEFVVREEENLKDYLYDAEELRTLPGKKFQKKRNLVNKFTREYEGRWEYRTLSCADRDTIVSFLDKWFDLHTSEDADGLDTLAYERRGLNGILEECCLLDYRIGGVFIDDKLEAVSIGTFNPAEEMACVSVEKANNDIPGIYQVINREFLAHEFPEAKIVNREDDMGLDGLRQAKMSYNPIGFERKYMVAQRAFEGKNVEIHDPFEEEIKSR